MSPSDNIDRSDFRNVMISGRNVGALTALTVVVFSLVAQGIGPGLVRDVVLSVLVLAAAVLVTFLPGYWVASRGTEGVAGAAAVGLWGTVVFMIIDVALFRPFDHFGRMTHFVVYPWTWDAIGGGSTWWYLPMWWMLGTLVAWLGGVLTAARSARGAATIIQIATPVIVGSLVLFIAGKVAGLPVFAPVLVGAGFVVSLVALAVTALARDGAQKETA